MKRVLFTSIAVIFAASAAPAADWSGFYAGLQAGLSTGGEITPTAPPVTPTAPPVTPTAPPVDRTAPPGPSIPFDTTVYGGFVGYNTQFDSVVLGAEIGGQMGSGTLNVGPGQNFDVNYLIDARARLGYSFGSAMFYVAGGYSAAKTTITTAPGLTRTTTAPGLTRTTTAPGLTRTTTAPALTRTTTEAALTRTTTPPGVTTTTTAPALTSTPSGWTVGGGVELMLTDNLFAGAEYDYRSLSGTALGSTYDMNLNTIRARIGYRF